MGAAVAAFLEGASADGMGNGGQPVAEEVAMRHFVVTRLWRLPPGRNTPTGAGPASNAKLLLYKSQHVVDLTTMYLASVGIGPKVELTWRVQDGSL